MLITIQQKTDDNVIRLGKYPQSDEDHAETIEWIVLKCNPETMLLISKYALITTAYCDARKVYEDLSFQEWEKSLAREACTHFYETAFSSDEKSIMVGRKAAGSISNDRDYVFLLTEEEVKAFLPDLNLRKAKPTRCALKKGARLGWTEDKREYTSWWIMPEVNEIKHGCVSSYKGLEYNKVIYPKAVFQNGDIQFHSRNIYHGDFTIRPCILVYYT